MTYASLVVSALAAVLAAAGGRWLLPATLVLVVSGLLDNLDGAVAVMTGRTTRWGYVLDSVVDRLSDLLYLVALVAVGAPLELAAMCGALVFLLEYSRARAGNAGGDEVGAVTVAERPTRVIVVAAALLAGGVAPGSADTLATVGVAVLAGLTVVGLVQLLPALKRSLPTSSVDAGDEHGDIVEAGRELLHERVGEPLGPCRSGRLHERGERLQADVEARCAGPRPGRRCRARRGRPGAGPRPGRPARCPAARRA